jgi:hypothetical protein
MENNTNTNIPQFDICDSLDEYTDIRKQQGELTGRLEILRAVGQTGYAVDSLEAQIQKLEFEAAAVSSEIVQTFVEMRKRIARLEEDLEDARDEANMEKKRSSFYQRVSHALGSA